MLVKICGLTSLSDALAAIDLGADMLGFNFYPGSKRFLQLEECAAIQNGIIRSGRRTIAVGVFVNASRRDIETICTTCDLGYAQLSGDETPDFARSLPVLWIKAIRPREPTDASAAARQFSPRRQAAGPSQPAASIPRLLVDAYHPIEYGGSGTTGDWKSARALARKLPILLAGGLDPANVAAAVEQVRPAGVDVATGVEASPGVKDFEKMRQFIRSARSVAE